MTLPLRSMHRAPVGPDDEQRAGVGEQKQGDHAGDRARRRGGDVDRTDGVGWSSGAEASAPRKRRPPASSILRADCGF